MRSAYLCIIAVVLIVGHLLASQVAAGSYPLLEPKIGVAFDQELFELAYTVFLANSNLTEALAVTERSIQARPSDKAWRVKGAQTAEWAGRPDLALQHWFFLAQQGNKSAVQSALRISRSLNELPLRKRLLELLLVESANQELQKEYLAVVEGLGLPEQAYALLVSGRLRSVDPLWQLTEQARLAETLGRPGEAFAAWEKRAALKPLNTEESLHLASLWYGQGNAAQALKVLRQVAQTAPDEATSFWRTYTDLSWTLQEIPESIAGAERLIRTGNGLESDYQRILLTFQDSDPERAYLTARAGWQRFSKPVWWYAMVETGLRCDQAKELALFFNGMTPDERSLLLRDGRSWYYLALVHRQNGNREASLMAARTAVQRDKNNADLLSACLWLLVDLKQTEALRPLVMEWETRIAAAPELREPMAAAMLLLGEPARALPVYRILARSRQDDPAWLASYGDVLEQAGYPDTAWKVRHRAHNLVARRIGSGSETSDGNRQDMLIQAQLMIHLSQGDRLSRLIQRIADGTTNDNGRELVMGWAMASGQTDLARFWYWRSFARATERPEWVRLGLALEENDQTGIADVIESNLERLPYRDAIEGARRAGQTPTAESLAFENFQRNTQDHLLDKQLRDLYGFHPAKLNYNSGISDRSGVGLLEQQLMATLLLDNRVRLDAELGTTEIRHQKTGIMGMYPSSKQKILFGLGYRHEGGDAGIGAGMYDGLYRHPTVQLFGNGRFTSRLTADVKIDAGTEANESVPLLIGGMKDEIALGVSYRLTERDSMRLRGATSRFLDQKRRYLGEGSCLDGEVAHSLNEIWPDSTLRLFGGYHQYRANGTPVEKTSALIPSDAPKNAGFFIPASFGQIGAGIAVGQTWKETYTRNWKPFGAVNAFWNSISDAGFMYEVGGAGPLFGLDTLLLSLSQESGALGSRDLSTRIDLKYRFLFN